MPQYMALRHKSKHLRRLGRLKSPGHKKMTESTGTFARKFQSVGPKNCW